MEIYYDACAKVGINPRAVALIARGLEKYAIQVAGEMEAHIVDGGEGELHFSPPAEGQSPDKFLDDVQE